MQPSDIEQLTMEDYWRWCDLASEENARRTRALKG